MATLTKFEDIEGWRKARELANAVYALTRRVHFAKDFALRDQIIRSAISVMANIAEGFEREGNREFANFLSTAKASLAETKSHLYLALDQKYLTSSEFDHLAVLISETGRLIGGFMRYLRQSDLTGRKFRPENVPHQQPAKTRFSLQTRNSKPETRN